MVILGINGWMERSHDAAACLVIDGQIVAMVEEERLTRQKNSFDKLPLNAIAYCIQKGRITPDDISVIAWGWDFPLIYKLHGRDFLFSTKELNELLFPKKYYPKKERVIPVEFISHHLAHAASVYCARDNDDSLPIVVVDGSSEDCSVSIYLGKNGKIEKLREYPMQISPGFFYEAGCKYLGFSTWQVGRFTGREFISALARKEEVFIPKQETCCETNRLATPRWARLWVSKQPRQPSRFRVASAQNSFSDSPKLRRSFGSPGGTSLSDTPVALRNADS